MKEGLLPLRRLRYKSFTKKKKTFSLLDYENKVIKSILFKLGLQIIQVNQD
jgi:hypothetical protein